MLKLINTWPAVGKYQTILIPQIKITSYNHDAHQQFINILKTWLRKPSIRYDFHDRNGLKLCEKFPGPFDIPQQIFSQTEWNEDCVRQFSGPTFHCRVPGAFLAPPRPSVCWWGGCHRSADWPSRECWTTCVDRCHWAIYPPLEITNTHMNAPWDQ